MGNAISGVINPELTEVKATMNTAPQDCTSKVRANPMRKKIRAFIEAKLLKSTHSVMKISPCFIKEKERKIRAKPMIA
jgi:hypothetical protein